MKIVFRHGDPTQSPLDIYAWTAIQATAKSAVPACLVCAQPVIFKCPKSQPDAYFSHYPFSSCPLILRKGGQISSFKNMLRYNRGDGRAEQLKRDLLENIENIYYTAASYCYDLTWNELIDAIKEASKLDIWTLANVTAYHLPYIILCCASHFDPTTPSRNRQYRAHKTYFALEPEATDAQYWGNSSKAKHVWRITETPGETPTSHLHSLSSTSIFSVVVDINSKILTIQKKPMHLQFAEPWYLAKVRLALEGK